MQKPISPQINSLIDLIVEAVLREMEDEKLRLKLTNAAPPTKDARGVQEAKHDNSIIDRK